MKTYLVGGAVRDKLLNLPVKDHDWVVVGATPQAMKKQGFVPVGKDFPVFLHPTTKEEYALARTERKSGHGYAGFVFHTSPEVSIEEDLIRRDLTINAIAEDKEGNLIDPYQGQRDLQSKLLRHVSPAFQEDPLRILRVARFAARFSHLSFSIASETMQLMRSMVDSGEASHLVAERVWQETVRALMEPTPEVYFQTLRSCDALQVVMPELHELLKYSDNLENLKQAASQQAKDVVRFGCLFAGSPDFADNIKTMSFRMRLPVPFAEMATLVIQHAGMIPQTLQRIEAESLMQLFEACDAIRRPERFSDLLECTRTISSSLTEQSVADTCQKLDNIRQMNAREIVAQGYKGKEVGERLRAARLQKLELLIGSLS